MSGLVNGLQNRLRRFESARHLTKKSSLKRAALFLFTFAKYVLVMLRLKVCVLHNITELLLSVYRTATIRSPNRYLPFTDRYWR